MAVSGDGAINNGEIHFFQTVVVKAEPCHNTGPESFNNDVVFTNKAIDNLHCPRMLQIQVYLFCPRPRYAVAADSFVPGTKGEDRSARSVLEPEVTLNISTPMSTMPSVAYVPGRSIVIIKNFQSFKWS